jgi:hypothetical protein
MRTARIWLTAILVAFPGSAWSLGSFGLVTSDLLSSTTMESLTSITPLSGLTFDTVTVGTVALALEIEEMKPSAQSPHHNAVVITNGVSNTADLGVNSGLITIQQAAGGANVTMALTNIVVAPGLGVSSVPSALATNDPTVFIIGALNQPFTVTNSYWFAQVLNKQLLVDAFVAGSASASNAIAADVLTVGLNEFSPHHNLGRSSTGENQATMVGNPTIGTIQQAAGFSNVQEAMNTILVGSSQTIVGTDALVVQP